MPTLPVNICQESSAEKRLPVDSVTQFYGLSGASLAAQLIIILLAALYHETKSELYGESTGRTGQTVEFEAISLLDPALC